MLCMEAVSPKQYWRISMYHPFLDHLITELESRLLSTENRFHAQHLLPRAVDKITNDYVASIYEAYQTDIDLSLEDSRREVARWRTSWAIKKRNDLSTLCTRASKRNFGRRNNTALGPEDRLKLLSKLWIWVENTNERGWACTSVRDPESQERAHESLKSPIDILFWFFIIIIFVFSTQIHNFERSFSLSSGPKAVLFRLPKELKLQSRKVDGCGPSSVVKIVKMKYNQIDIKMWLVSTSFKINTYIFSNLYITYTIFNYNTISLRCSLFPVPVKGLYQRLYFILTILITEDGPQPSTLSDCNFNSSAGEVSGTQGLWEGVSLYIGTGPGEPRKGTWISEGSHWHFILIFHYNYFCIFNSNPQFWEKFQSVLGPQSSIVPPCKISLGTKCWQIITFCNGPTGSPTGNFSPGIF
jgi:hypothetical protein